MGLDRSQGKEAWKSIRHVANENENDEVEGDMLKTRTSFNIKWRKKNCSEVEREANNTTTADQSLRERGRA